LRTFGDAESIVIDDSELTTLARVDMPVESKGVSLSLFRF